MPGCASCAARDEEIALLREQAEAQRARIGELEEKVARLERLLSRNSGNSSMPPWADDLPGRKQPQDRKRGHAGSKRRPGKQPGAPGAHLAWNDHPDTRTGHFPRGDCACGRDLREAEDLGVTASHQVTDIPPQQAQPTWLFQLATLLLQPEVKPFLAQVPPFG